MAHLLDAQALIDTFDETDGRMPALVFALLKIYLDEGPFEFDSAALSRRLADDGERPARANPEELAEFQPQLERFFLPTAEGWVPRPGVLVIENGSTPEADLSSLSRLS